jgi:hypothetical protein
MNSTTKRAAVVVTTCLAAWLFSGQASPAITAFDSDYCVIQIRTETADEGTVATIEVKKKGTYYCNLDYPWKLEITPAEGVTLDKNTFRREDAEKATADEVVYIVRYTAEPETPINAELKLCLCDGKTCQTKMIPLTW